jgi:hypothetical protein
MNSYKRIYGCIIFFFFFIYNLQVVSQQVSRSDGPYIFYKGDKIAAKTILVTGDSARVKEEVFNNKKEAVVNCYVAETGDKFSFKLHSFKIEKPVSKLPAKIFAISDIHANFKGLKNILIGAGVIDKNLNWSFGKGHFVFDGDVFDRGANPTECMWLIYKLEQEAVKAGGKVHFILGNHELLNLYGITRYVNKNILENVPLLKEEYKNLYNADTELGRWFRTKNGIERIGDFIFVHAGISPGLDSLNLSLDKINKITRNFIGKTKDQITDKLEILLAGGKVSPYWFRGFILNPISKDTAAKIFSDMKAERIIIGHTIIENIKSFYGGKVVAINEDHQKNSDNGFMHGLLILGKKFFVIDDKGVKKALAD